MHGLSSNCIGVVYDSVVLSKVLHRLAGWGGRLQCVSESL